MKYLYIILAVLTLSSCSGYYHIKQAKKHTQKAINKGVEPLNDTTFVTISDTITEIDTIDNYIRITKTIRDTIKAECETVYIAKSRVEVRQEKKTERTQIRQDEKTERKQAKEERKKAVKVAKQEAKRSFWWLCFLIGFGVCFILLKFDSIIKQVSKL